MNGEEQACERKTAGELYAAYSTAMAYVAVRDAKGAESIGSAFHVGDGIFVTARHVVEGKEIVDIATAASSYVRLEGEEAEASLLTVYAGPDDSFKAHSVEPGTLQITRGPVFHADENIDVAAFETAGLDRHAAYVLLGGHLDDWLGDSDFVLSDVVVLGFPPVPFSHRPHLIAAKGEVNALLDLRHSRHPHFLISTMARGGFSGGVMISEHGFALGVVTASLGMNFQPEELGFMAVLSVEPIYSCLAQHHMLPVHVAEEWDNFWNTEVISYTAPDESGVRKEVASVQHHNDGRRFYMEIRCQRTRLRDNAVDAVRRAVGNSVPCEVSVVERGGIRITLSGGEHPEVSLAAAVAAASLSLEGSGYQRCKSAL